MPFGPTPRDIGEHGQNRNLVVVVPKEKWIMPEQHKTKRDDNRSGSERTEEI
jgi:hypothetical protein